MNILPKKSWHVRNKDNVARVRKDEAQALQEEKELARRKAIAEQEARIKILRSRRAELDAIAKSSETADQKKEVEEEEDWRLPQEPEFVDSDDDDKNTTESPPPKDEEYEPLNTAHRPDKHINLFEEFEKKMKRQGPNKEYEAEKRKAQENYEKKIGYLTYLGQSAPEMAEKKPWYEEEPASRANDNRMKHSSRELLRTSDPLIAMTKYLDKKKAIENKSFGKEQKKEIPEHSRKRSQDDKRMENKESKRDSTSGDSSHRHKKDKIDKKHKKKKTSGESPGTSSIEELRRKRERRERHEKRRSIELIQKIQGSNSSHSSHAESVERTHKYSNKYNPDFRLYRK